MKLISAVARQFSSKLWWQKYFIIIIMYDRDPQKLLLFYPGQELNSHWWSGSLIILSTYSCHYFRTYHQFCYLLSSISNFRSFFFVLSYFVWEPMSIGMVNYSCFRIDNYLQYLFSFGHVGLMTRTFLDVLYQFIYT